MPRTIADAGRMLDILRESLAEAIVERHYLLNPELATRFGPPGRQKCREDCSYHLRHLAQALSASSPTLFTDYVVWARVMLEGRGIPARDLADNLRVTIDVLNERLTLDDAAAANSFVQAAITELSRPAAAPSSFITAGEPLASLAQVYLAALLALDRQKASRLILDAVANGTSIKDVYVHVFQQSQREIGRLWQVNQITVAQEHHCTAATQMVMSQLYPQIFAGPRIGRSFVGASVNGDLHELGIRMVADFFEMDGWDTVFLGASVPSPDLIKTLQQRNPDVVGISATITPHVGAVAQIVLAIRAVPACNHIKILVGGYPFLLVPDLWQQLHADGSSATAQGAVDAATRLISARGAA